VLLKAVDLTMLAPAPARWIACPGLRLGEISNDNRSRLRACSRLRHFLQDRSRSDAHARDPSQEIDHLLLVIGKLVRVEVLAHDHRVARYSSSLCRARRAGEIINSNQRDYRPIR
jgi:hypothetical protein